MSSFRLLPFDLMKEIVAYLDFDTCAILISTLDVQIQRFFRSPSALARLEIPTKKSSFYPSHRHLLQSLNGISLLRLEGSATWLMEEETIPLLSSLDPQQLELQLENVEYPIDFAAHFKSALTLDLDLGGELIDLGDLIARLPPLLARFRLFTRLSSYSHCRDGALDRLMQAMPLQLVELDLDIHSCTQTHTMDFGAIFTGLPHLEVLRVGGVYLECEEDDLAVPIGLTSLALLPRYLYQDSYDINSALRGLGIGDGAGRGFENRFPSCLTHMELFLEPILGLPHTLTSLVVSCGDTHYLQELVEEVLPFLASLRSLFISLFLPIPMLVLALPNYLTSLTMRFTHEAFMTPEELEFCFGREYLRSPTLSLTLVIEYATLEELKMLCAQEWRNCKIRVEDPMELSAGEWKRFAHAYASIQLASCFTPTLLLASLASYLNMEANRLEVAICFCVKCLQEWRKHPKSRLASCTETVSILQERKMGAVLAVYDGLKLVDLNPWEDETNCSYPHGASELSFEVVNHRPLERYDPPELAEEPRPGNSTLSTDPYVEIYLEDLIPMHSMNHQARWKHLFRLDFDAVPLRADDYLWKCIPASVTYLRSIHQPEPQVKFGGRAQRVLPFFNKPLISPLKFVTLDTPYFVYDFNSIKRITEPSRLRVLAATLSDEDSKIFEFALHRGKCSVIDATQLEMLSLRAYPIVTGLLGTRPNSTGDKDEMARNTIEALRRAGVFGDIQCRSLDDTH